MSQRKLEEVMTEEDALKYRNIANQAHFFEEALLDIIVGGKRVSEVFKTSNERGRLIKHGVLDYDYGDSGKTTFVTDIVKQLLRERHGE